MSDQETLEANKDLVRRMNKAWSQPDTDALDEIYHEDYEEISSGLKFRGRGPLKEFHSQIHAAVPDYTETTDILVAEGDRVAVRFISRGTITGGKYFVQPDGQSFEYSNTGIYTVRDGRLQQFIPDIDLYGLLVGLGVIPDLGESIFD